MKGTVIKKCGSWYCVYRVGGRQRWKKGGSTKREAERTLAGIVNEVHQGTYREIKEIGFKDYAELWLKTYARTKCKATTVRSYEDIIKGHLVPYFDNYPLTSISPASVQKYVVDKLSEKKRKDRKLVPRLSPKTVNNHLVPLKAMLKHAVRWGYLKESPAMYVEKPRVEHEEMEFLTPEEARLFLKNVTPKLYPLFLTAVSTGLRRGELLALQWGDIDFANSAIHIRRALYKGLFTTPKSKRSMRRVVMTPTLARTLKRHRLESPANKLELVFANIEGKPMDGDNLVRREFLPALRRAGLRKVRFHDLRHTFATLLISQGENVKLIQSQLGHASIQTTLDRYGHLLPESHLEAGMRLDETLGMKEENGGFVRKVLENGPSDKKQEATESRNPLILFGSGDRI